jgi:hypothetical protein
MSGYRPDRPAFIPVNNIWDALLSCDGGATPRSKIVDLGRPKLARSVEAFAARRGGEGT